MMSDYPFLPYRPERFDPHTMLQRAQCWQTQLSKRRSVRHFSPNPVPRRLIELAILTAGSAPSGANRQPWKFVAVSNPAVKRDIRIAAEREERHAYEGGGMPAEWRDAIAHFQTSWQKPYLEIAPWLVVVFEQAYRWDDRGRKSKNYYVKESVGMACGLFLTAIHNMGLVTLTHTPSPMSFLTEILQRPQNERPYVLLPVGYASAEAEVPDQPRKTLDQLAVWFE